MIISGGENIYPAEIENVLMRHPAVTDAAVIGIPHEKWGETPKAIVVRSSGNAVDEQQIVAFCRTQLAGFKCPTSRSEEHTSELQSLMSISYDVFCLKK